jgi:hypothetical protein
VQPGLWVPELGRPIAGCTTLEYAKLQIQDPFVLDPGGDHIEDVPLIGYYPFKPESMSAHPQAEFQVVHERLKLVQL